jgi:tetratricopeptide (TPR) repeat protein
MQDIFQSVHKYLKTGKYGSVLGMLFEPNGKILRMRYRSDRSDENHAWYLVGDIYFRRKDYRRAARAFKHSLRCYPYDGDALWALGDCYSEVNRPTLAEQYYRKAMRYCGRNNKAMLLFNLANSFLDQGKFYRSICLYRLIPRHNKELARRVDKNFSSAKKGVIPRQRQN